jgi:hypothetical protein
LRSISQQVSSCPIRAQLVVLGGAQHEGWQDAAEKALPLSPARLLFPGREVVGFGSAALLLAREWVTGAGHPDTLADHADLARRTGEADSK